MKSFLLLLTCIIAAPSFGFINEHKRDSPDQAFAIKAADGGMAEVMLGNLAQKNGGSEKIKSFGKTMVTDHSKVNQELKEAAKTKQIALPVKVSAAKQAEYDRLAGLSGGNFDKSYKDVMVSSHQETIALFEAEAANGKDPELKKWAEAKLPALKHHLEMAKMLVAEK